MKCSNTIISDVRNLLWLVVFASLVFLSSCAGYNNVPRESLPATGPALMEVSPWAVEVFGYGDTTIVFVKVMDRDSNPIPDQKVFATMEDPAVANIEEHEVTDKKGLARFTITAGGMPSSTELTFTADTASTKIHVWKAGYGPYGW